MTGEPGRYGSRRTCRRCRRPSLYLLCQPCYQAEQSRDHLAPSREWSVCTRCGSLNGRHATGCTQ
jgi:NMD protein affecting ribosome stability and mRNA decay